MKACAAVLLPLLVDRIGTAADLVDTMAVLVEWRSLIDQNAVSDAEAHPRITSALV